MGGSYTEQRKTTSFLRIPRQTLTIALKENKSTDKSQIDSRDLVIIYQTAYLFQAMG